MPTASHDRIARLFAGGQARSAGEVASALGISRQAAHRHLVALVGEGQLQVEGRGRAVRYRGARSLPFSRRYPRAVAEDRVWNELAAELPALVRLGPDARGVFQYAFTEMLNNAIEHSGSPEIEVRIEAIPRGLAFEIIDAGRGAFANLRRTLRLPSEVDALAQLSKGKLTTLPAGHTGEGIFFTSKVADHFTLESGTLRWEVDNLRGDVGVGEVPRRRGTRVRFEAATKVRRKLADVFAAFTDDLEFAKTRVVIKLFAIGTRFVSRSEARRVAVGLDRFRDVVFDYRGVEEVGQGFVDELYRVWGSAHPDIKLTSTAANRAVAFMLRRGGAAA
ncbi:MAG TPA: ATP-binding protein [Polyangia bacterium]|jgi:anti-sigma regulatory factor (Ser/Thr protein kinase)|nr:ATP-binding protein [Polyangia bacterium]